MVTVALSQLSWTSSFSLESLLDSNILFFILYFVLAAEYYRGSLVVCYELMTYEGCPALAEDETQPHEPYSPQLRRYLHGMVNVS